MRGFFLILLLVAAAGIALYLYPPRVPLPDVQFTQEDVKQLIVSELHQELPAAFLVSGHLEISADITQENTKYLFPNYFDKSISLGTTKSTVRLPGRVSYGIDLMQIDAASISFEPNNVVVISIDALEIESVDPDLANMQVQTEVGWARMHARSGATIERKAVVIAKDALEAEALSHLQTSPQPIYNTEAALSRILVPVLEAAGFPNATIRIQKGSRFVYLNGKLHVDDVKLSQFLKLSKIFETIDRGESLRLASKGRCTGSGYLKCIDEGPNRGS